MTSQPTQVRRPWRATVRTIFAAIIAAAALAPAVYTAATQHDPGAAGGYAGLGLAIAAGITRVMALPGVERFLARFFPWLAADPTPRTRPGRRRKTQAGAVRLDVGFIVAVALAIVIGWALVQLLVWLVG